MLKHIDDDGDLSVFAGDEGLLFVCKKCGRTWQTAAQAVQSSPRATGRGAAARVRGNTTEGGLAARYVHEDRMLLKRAQNRYSDAFGPVE